MSLVDAGISHDAVKAEPERSRRQLCLPVRDPHVLNVDERYEGGYRLVAGRCRPRPSETSAF